MSEVERQRIKGAINWRLLSIMRDLAGTIHNCEIAGLAGDASKLSVLYRSIEEVRSNVSEGEPQQMLDLFQLPDAVLELRVHIEGRYVCWEYDDEECEYSRASFEQLDREARVQILQRARDFFAAKYGTWFVESGFARTPDEAALLVNSVTLWNADEVEIETVANVSLHNKRQAMLFKLAFAENIVADDDEEDD